MKNRSHPPFWNYPIDCLDRVSQSEWCFFLVLGAIRCVVRPYSGITHDAQLYCLQAMNRATGGFFDGDLFFLCGSQDSYSIFSILMAPWVAALGPAWSFMLVYTAAAALLIFAEIRLVRRFVPDRRAANVALVLLAVTELPWAGLGVFRLHEPFLTARLPAVALTLLGLERLLSGRRLAASMLMLLAFALHPLMAFGGILVGAGYFCATKLPSKFLLWIAVSAFTAAAVVGAIMLWSPAATKLFGYVDPAWYDVVRRRTPYNFLSAWSTADWWWVAYSLGVLTVTGKYLDRPAAIMTRLVILLGLAAVAGSAMAEWCPSALLLKGQPYRALWLVQFLAVPLGVLLMFRLWEKGTIAARLGAIFVLSATGRLFLLPPAAGSSWMRVLGQAPGEFGDAALALIAVVAVALFYSAARQVRVTACAAAILWCAGATAAFRFEDHLKGFGSFAEDRPHVGFVRQFIHEHRKDRSGAPTVYWPTDPTYVWFDLPAASFYSWSQTAGVVYHRGTAIQGQRRALLVRSFEIANLRKHYRRDVFRRHFSSFYQAGFDQPPPTRQDLIALCRAEPLDFVVLRQKFGGLAAATNGAVFIYDCRSIRDEQIDVNPGPID